MMVHYKRSVVFLISALAAVHSMVSVQTKAMANASLKTDLRALSLTPHELSFKKRWQKEHTLLPGQAVSMASFTVLQQEHRRWWKIVQEARTTLSRIDNHLLQEFMRLKHGALSRMVEKASRLGALSSGSCFRPCGQNAFTDNRDVFLMSASEASFCRVWREKCRYHPAVEMHGECYGIVLRARKARISPEEQSRKEEYERLHKLSMNSYTVGSGLEEVSPC